MPPQRWFEGCLRHPQFMDKALLEATAAALVAPGKGILAADESTGTIKKRLDSINVESTELTRKTYRNLLFTTKSLEQYLILKDGVAEFHRLSWGRASNVSPLPQAPLINRNK